MDSTKEIIYRDAIGINLDTALERFMGNTELLDKLLKRLPDNGDYRNLLAAVEEGDVHKAFRSVHGLKGLCGNLSLDELYKRTAELTEYFRDEKFEEGRQYLPYVVEEFERVSDNIKKYI